MMLLLRAAFPYADQAFLIERIVRDPHGGHLISAVAALGITSRNVGRGGTPEAIAIAARRDWDIEALHHGHHHARRRPAAPLRIIRPGHRRHPQHRHRRLPLCGFTGSAAGRRWAARNPARTVAALGLTY